MKRTISASRTTMKRNQLRIDQVIGEEKKRHAWSEQHKRVWLKPAILKELWDLQNAWSHLPNTLESHYFMSLTEKHLSFPRFHRELLSQAPGAK